MQPVRCMTIVWHSRPALAVAGFAHFIALPIFDNTQCKFSIARFRLHLLIPYQTAFALVLFLLRLILTFALCMAPGLFNFASWLFANLQFYPTLTKSSLFSLGFDCAVCRVSNGGLLVFISGKTSHTGGMAAAVSRQDGARSVY